MYPLTQTTHEFSSRTSRSHACPDAQTAISCTTPIRHAEFIVLVNKKGNHNTIPKMDRIGTKKNWDKNDLSPIRAAKKKWRKARMAERPKCGRKATNQKKTELGFPAGTEKIGKGRKVKRKKIRVYQFLLIGNIMTIFEESEPYFLDKKYS